MSSLSRKEKQALNDLFDALREKENLLQKIKKTKKIFLVFTCIFKLKKAKHTSV